MFNLRRFAIWLTICVVAAWFLARWPASQIGRVFAPLVLFPLLEGLALGGGMLLLLRLCDQGNRLATVAGLVLTAMVFVVAQHYASFRAAQAAAVELQEAIASRSSGANSKQAFAAVAAQLAPQPPDSLFQYLQEEAKRGRPLFSDVTARGGWAWASWAFDGLLVLTAAAVVVVPATKQPYCNKCRSWYRVVRAAEISGNSEKAIRSACGFADEHPFRATRLVLLSCRGGCGPDALDLFRESNEMGPASRQTRIWLSIAQRQALTSILDQQSAQGGTES